MVQYSTVQYSTVKYSTGITLGTFQVMKGPHGDNENHPKKSILKPDLMREDKRKTNTFGNRFGCYLNKFVCTVLCLVYFYFITTKLYIFSSLINRSP